MGDALFAGTRVKHATKTDWGLGEVLDAPPGGKITVFFEDVGLKEFDPKFAKFTVVGGEEASSDYLTGLVSYLKKHGATANSPKNTASAQTTFSDAIKKFLRHFPNGFGDPAYSRHERDYKDAAHKVMHGLLAKDSLADLLKRNDFLEVCNRVKSIINKTNLICPYEKIWLGNGLATPGAQQTFAEALNMMLHGDSSMKERFENFAEILYEINAAKWPIATYFWFIFDPVNHVFVKPEVTKKMASAIGCEINYQPELKWLTYSSVLDLANAIREKLVKENIENLIPRDMIDVQSFIWVAASYD